ncbi:RNA ligase family protein [Cereibacter sphaeroides]|uniref:RNA ligase family protein n=1 Tax=Cereibacter sphaeroides TaxID=1063 RepID=UPI001F368278|nr:RNA ligase family protein [Cereibacter sphaeroides]MCE6959226.1 RNA ligase family protein [Cereibacter sphaeroides]MCE6972029.1 RNA ligase family protein [Cereibacter sphaeroides]
MSEDFPLRKYPRTPHLEGSRLQPGDDTSDQVSIAELRARFPNARWISEEKLDGANSGISTSRDLDLRIQSRGHFLQGGAREGQFNLLKEWVTAFEGEILERIEDRYEAYGEWLFAKHTQSYDALPHYWHEFDVWDRKEEIWLSTPRRHALFRDSCVVAVPVVSEAWPRDLTELKSWVKPSVYRTENWRENLTLAAEDAGLDPLQILKESGADKPDADLAEGLYVKIEDDDQVLGRFKWVRPGFLQTILESGTHWAARPLVRNRLAPGVDLFARPEPPPSPSP